MALVQIVKNTTTNKDIAVLYPGFTDEKFTASNGQTVFALAKDIDAAHFIDAWVDGRLQEETTHWTRNVTTNEITFTAGVTAGSLVKFRIYNK